MSEPKITFNGPPPGSTRDRNELRLAIDEHPGEWAQVTVGTSQQAASKAYYLRRLGYEAVSRGNTTYARKAPSA